MHLLVPRSRSSAKVKVKYKGYISQKMAVSGVFVFHKHILFTICFVRYSLRYLYTSSPSSVCPKSSLDIVIVSLVSGSLIPCKHSKSQAVCNYIVDHNSKTSHVNNPFQNDKFWTLPN